MTLTTDVTVTTDVACGTGKYATGETGRMGPAGRAAGATIEGVTYRVVRTQRVRPTRLATTRFSKGRTVS